VEEDDEQQVSNMGRFAKKLLAAGSHEIVNHRGRRREAIKSEDRMREVKGDGGEKR